MAQCQPCAPCKESSSSLTTILGIGLIIGLIAWLMSKPTPAMAAAQSVSSGTYNNKEEWNVAYNELGMPTKVTVHRKAVRT